MELADTILSGAFHGEFDVALNRAAAFCLVVSAGAAVDADWIDLSDARLAHAVTQRAHSLALTAQDLTEAATLWRAKRLD
jgi:hypothetical protein